MLPIYLWFILQSITIPFISQTGIGWYKNNDCGAAVAGMVYEYYTKEAIPVQQLYAELPLDNDTGMTGYDIAQWLNDKGIDAEYLTSMSVDQLMRGSIVEVDYAVLRRNGVANGKTWGTHFMVVIDVNEKDNWILVHDPLVGPNQLLPLDIFEIAWSEPNNWLNNTGVIVNGATN